MTSDALSWLGHTALNLASDTIPAAARVGAGRIQGGWGYVWTCYGVTWSALVLYSLSLWRRSRQARSGKEAL